MAKEPIELVISREEERCEVAKILVRNGYTVSPKKRKKTPTGKAIEYFLSVTKETEG